ncbi:MAG: MBL fold metallo-hydrolase [Desulfobacterales bacterium]
MAHPPEISVTILGSGTCVPSLKRSACSVLMNIGDTKLLFDAGPGTMRRLLESGTTIFDIAFIFFSHLHPDHTGELVPFLFATKYPNEHQRKIPLHILSGKGFSTMHKGLKSVYGSWIEQAPDLLKITELDNKGPDFREFDNFRVDSRPTEHNEESIAFRITGKGGRSVVYSGDTDFNENLVALAADADLFICESAFPDRFKVKGHLTPSLAGEIASRANVGKLILTHFYPECDNVNIEKECRKTYNGPLILANDLLKIELN